MRIRHAALVLAAPFLLIAAGCSDEPASEASPITMTEQQPIATRPLCVGRFLIDVPVDTTVTGTQTTSAGVSGTISLQTGVSKSAFNLKMAGIETRLRSAVHETEGSRLSEVVRRDETTYIFRYRKSEIGARVYQIDGYRWVDSTMFAIVSGSSNDEFRSVVDDVTQGLFEVKPRDTWTIPTEPGFCFDAGFLPGGDGGFEATGVQLEFPGFPNLLIAFSTRANDGPPPEGAQLLTRTDAVLQGVDGSDRPTVLRREGTRPLGERTAQEVMWKWVKSGSVMLSGNLELYASSHRLDAPEISFELALDPPEKEGDANTDEQDALLLWDTIIQSLRLRPGAV